MTEIRIKSRIRDYSVKFAPIGKLDKFVIHGENIDKLYKFSPSPIVINAVEANKSLQYVETLIGRLLEAGLKRSDKLTVIGGGIVQDIVGFTASVILRGVNWTFYPTTLLAMVDSCIGGKTCINKDGFKNQLGTFYPPSEVIIDTNFLKTLSPGDMKSGMGEVIKVHLLAGKEIPLPLEDMIHSSLMIKKGFIEEDEFDWGVRHILGFGHTFGHALESVSGYTIPHGQAVASGVVIAGFISHKLGFLPLDDYKRMQLALSNYSDVSIDDFPSYMAALKKDKKNTSDNLNCILPLTWGNMKEISIPFDKVESLLKCFVKCQR